MRCFGFWILNTYIYKHCPHIDEITWLHLPPRTRTRTDRVHTASGRGATTDWRTRGRVSRRAATRRAVSRAAERADAERRRYASSAPLAGLGETDTIAWFCFPTHSRARIYLSWSQNSILPERHFRNYRAVSSFYHSSSPFEFLSFDSHAHAFLRSKPIFRVGKK